VEIDPGLFLFQRYLSPADQRAIWKTCFRLSGSGTRQLQRFSPLSGIRIAAGWLEVSQWHIDRQAVS
jgi:hypothetical protein